SRKPRASLILRGYEGCEGCAAFSRDGTRIAAGGEYGRVKLWDTDSGELLATLVHGQTTVTCVAFSPDGERLASGDCKGTVKVWNVETQRELAAIRVGRPFCEAIAVAFSPDGSSIVSSSSDGTVKLW
ncbi:serine/threonine protein kinase, partial [bacterium]|nr:serine/threonine protein kinase [bacterium]